MTRVIVTQQWQLRSHYWNLLFQWHRSILVQQWPNAVLNNGTEVIVGTHCYSTLISVYFSATMHYTCGLNNTFGMSVQSKEYTFPFSIIQFRGSESSFSTVSRLRALRSGFESRQGRIFLFATKSRSALGPTQPPIPMDIGFISSGTKSPKRETNNSPLFNIEFKMREAILFLLHTSPRHGD
jgi:hypothetical protein